MNRSLTNVLFGGIGSPASQDAYKIEGSITKATVDDAVEALLNADSVILVRFHNAHGAQHSVIFRALPRWLVTVWLLQRLSMPFPRFVPCSEPKM